jgi:hypothetical protein
MRRRCKECQEARTIASRSSKQVAPHRSMPQPLIILGDAIRRTGGCAPSVLCPCPHTHPPLHKPDLLGRLVFLFQAVPRVAAATAWNAPVQGVAQVRTSPHEWRRATEETIKAVRKARDVLTSAGVIPPPPRYGSEAIVYSAWPSLAR